MKLTNDIKDKISKAHAHMLDEEYKATTAQMRTVFINATALYLSASLEIKNRAQLLEDYPDYMFGTDKVFVDIPLKDSKYPTTVEVKLGFEFAMKVGKTYYGNETVKYTVGLNELGGDAYEHGMNLKERLEKNDDFRVHLNSILTRVTTSRQLIKEEPRCQIFFDDEGQFYIPEFGRR